MFMKQQYKYLENPQTVITLLLCFYATNLCMHIQYMYQYVLLFIEHALKRHFFMHVHVFSRIKKLFRFISKVKKHSSVYKRGSCSEEYHTNQKIKVCVCVCVCGESKLINFNIYLVYIFFATLITLNLRKLTYESTNIFIFITINNYNYNITLCFH